VVREWGVARTEVLFSGYWRGGGPPPRGGGGGVAEARPRRPAGNTHFLDFFRGLDSDGHGGEQGGIRTAC